MAVDALCCLTEASAYPTNLMLCWMRGDNRPWLLATN